MPINAQNRSLPDWFTRVRTRQTVLPRFQRFEAWPRSTVTELFNTILQGLPIGAMLVLEVGNEEPFASRSIVGAPELGERVTEHLLDGQQRLTALWRGLHNNYEDRTYYLYLEPDEETGMEYYVDSIARWRDDQGRLRPLWANEAAQLWQRNMIPLDMFLPGDAGLARFRNWAREAIENADARERVSDIVTRVREAFVTFNLPYLSLPVATQRDVALNVFLRMNTSAEPLETYDIVVAQVEADTGASLHDLVAEARRECPAISSYYSANNLVLYVNALLQNAAPTNATYLSREFGASLVRNWGEILAGITRAVEFLEAERVFDAGRLPTDVALPVLTALCARAPQNLDAAGRARNTLRKYLWRAFFTNRYERSTTSRSLIDYREVSAFLIDAQAPVPAIFDNTQNSLPEEQELIAAGWPKQKDRLARAILALSLRGGGLDLADGGVITRAALDQREYHHLFPNAHLRGRGEPPDRIFRALNCALVTWQTNRNMAAQEPERYLAQRRNQAVLGEAEIRHRLATHIIPYDEMVGGDYDVFLARRAQLLHERMTALCTDAIE